MEIIQLMKVNENTSFKFGTKEAAWAFAVEVDDYGKSCDNKKVFAFSQQQLSTTFHLTVERLQ